MSGGNIATALSEVARRQPGATAVHVPLGQAGDAELRYRHVSYRELDEDSTRIALGIEAEHRLRHKGFTQQLPEGRARRRRYPHRQGVARFSHRSSRSRKTVFYVG